ncbi:MAG: helix-turn-helix transcriptional regulator [Limisphaerales bacterium]
MLDQDYLALRLIRLKSPEEWTPERQGLSFLFPKRGVGYYVSGRVAERLSTGDVLVIKGHQTGKVCALKRGEMVFWSFSLLVEHLAPLLAADEIFLLKQVTDSLKGARLYPAASRLAQKCHRLVASAPPQGDVEHRSQVLRIAAAVLSLEFKNARNQRVGFVRIRDHRTQMFEELSVAEFSTLSVEDMAHKFNYSRRHLNRLFHQHFGCSITSLRMEMRLSKALSLLRNPDLRIYKVAKQSGFNHLEHFRNCFKKRFGKTPGRWRKAAAQPEGPTGRLEAGSDCPLVAIGFCPWIRSHAKSRAKNAEPYRPRKTVLKP